MASIIINDTAAVKTNAESLMVDSEKIQSIKESIENILNEINEYWSANQEDQQVFAKNLQQNVTSLETIYTCNEEFSHSIIDYMQVTDTTSANTVS